MPQEKGDQWKYVTVVEETSRSGDASSHPKVTCIYCRKIFVANAVRIRSHLVSVGEKGSDIAKCSYAPEEVVLFFKQQDERKDEVAKKKKKTQELDKATNGLLRSDNNVVLVQLGRCSRQYLVHRT